MRRADVNEQRRAARLDRIIGVESDQLERAAILVVEREVARAVAVEVAGLDLVPGALPVDVRGRQREAVQHGVPPPELRVTSDLVIGDDVAE
jgi:hypothetical protein